MNKTDIANKLHKELHKHYDLKKPDIVMIVEMIFDTIKDSLHESEPVNIVGFGKFDTRNRIARIGRNPQTGDTLTIPATKTVSFQPSKLLKESVRDSGL